MFRKGAFSDALEDMVLKNFWGKLTDPIFPMTSSRLCYHFKVNAIIRHCTKCFSLTTKQRLQTTLSRMPSMTFYWAVIKMLGKIFYTAQRKMLATILHFAPARVLYKEFGLEAQKGWPPLH